MSKFFLLMIVGVVFLFGDAYAYMPTPSGASGAAAKGANSPAMEIRKVTAIVDKIDGNMVYTSQGNFDLTGAHVVDLSKKQKRHVHNARQVVEMTYVNEKLMEVIIH